VVQFVRKRLRIADFEYSEPSYVFFATMCARHHTKPFDIQSLAREVVAAIEWQRAHNRWKVYCYCLMPDHLHIVFSPTDSRVSLTDSVASFKRWTTRKSWEAGLHGALWQRSWYDHVARMEEDLVKICEYILNNPVRRTLVAKPGEWPYSGMPDPLPL
jgi:REP element-mobilizing transposase RayT